MAQRIEITKEMLDTFIHGRDPMEHIVCIECGYQDDEAYVIFRDNEGVKRVKREEFHPFMWAKVSFCLKLFGGNRQKLQAELKKWGIRCIGLITNYGDDPIPERMANGYTVMFQAQKKMSYSQFSRFFKYAGVALYDDKKKTEEDPKTKNSKEFIMLNPVEQFMMATGKRLFKGYESYDDLVRMTFDLETQGLNPEIHGIEQVGIRTNKGFEKILTIEGRGKERKENELKSIIEFLNYIKEIDPDVICGHNIENFDTNFFFVRSEVLGSSFKDLSEKIFKYPIYKRKKKAVLKIGGEVEYYNPTVVWGRYLVDSLHAVRRAQAMDSDMKKADLKYVTKYSKMNKPNRVYVPGDKISEIWNDYDHEYAFNDENGSWYIIDEKHPLKEGYESKTGDYVVMRYLLDDLYEGDKVECRYNEPNFLLCKMLPTGFSRACTMGTAAIWKMIMLSWSYENGLAIPDNAPKVNFVGGLSRLLVLGYIDKVAKLDYNSLYPSIDLTWGIKTPLDISNVMLYLLEYVLTERELYKGLKGKAGKEAGKYREQRNELEANGGDPKKIQELLLTIQHWESEESSNDKKQLPLKTVGNSFFGSYGSPNLFNWGDSICAEKTTCIGRQSLRLMISWFSNIGYRPIVGDSFSSDTPIFIKYDSDDRIDIKPIEELIDKDKIEIDALGREYDYSEKPYKVLCRSGWMKPEYVYRHDTDKQMYRVDDGRSVCDVTEDHSLFNEQGTKLKPSQLTPSIRLEYYKGSIEEIRKEYINDEKVKKWALLAAYRRLDRVPCDVLNGTKEQKELFIDTFLVHNHEQPITVETTTKTLMAGLLYLNKCLEENA